MSVYYYFALKQWALILCMCSLASRPARLDCHMSQIGFLGGGEAFILSCSAFPRKNYLKNKMFGLHPIFY